MQPQPAETAGPELPPLSVRRAIVATFRQIVRLYFREIERVGTAPSAATRGRVFVSNHHNALIDPILVLTDAACEISPIAKSTLWKIPGLRWLLDRAGAVPIIRRKDAPDKAQGSEGNAETFEKIAGHLAGGGNILIFPEGTSHSEPQLAPLRTGAARMLAAADQRGGVPLTFQAVALEFDARDDFRSRCLVLWGPIRALADVHATGEARIRAITEQMDADLRELLVEGVTHDERLLIARVAEMLANDTGDASLSGWNTIGRQVEHAGHVLREGSPAVVQHVQHHVDAYYAELARFGLGDAQLAAPRASAAKPRARWLRRAVLAPLAVPGFALYAIPYFIPRLVARSSDPDAVSTVKLGAALVVYPLWAAGLVSLSFVLLPPPLSLGAAAVAIASPFAALRWLDAYWTRTPEHAATPADLAQLARLRITARTAIDEARSRLPA